jgi:hypothetical protein
MRTVLETWTPDRAAETLARRDPRSRPIAPKTVDKYASDMASHRWGYNPHGIVLGPAGEPIDGNHRLTALVKAGVPVAFLTTYVSDPALALDLKLKIDTGRSRSVGDILELTEGVRSGNHRAAIAVALDLLESATARPLSVEQTRDVIARYREGIEWAMVALAAGEFNAPIRAAFVYAWAAQRAASRSTEPIDALVHLVRQGAGEIGSPSAVYAVAAKAGKFRAGRERRAVILRVLRILKAQVCGEPAPARLYARTRGRIVGEGEIDADGIGFAYFRTLRETAAASPVLATNPWLAALEAIERKPVL